MGCVLRAYASQPELKYPTCLTCKERYDGKVAVMLLLARSGAEPEGTHAALRRR